MSTPEPCVWLHPASRAPAVVTGGDRYNARMVAALRAGGRAVDVVHSVDVLRRRGLGVGRGPVFVDSLFYDQAEILRPHVERLVWLVHWLPSSVRLGRAPRRDELSEAEVCAFDLGDHFVVPGSFVGGCLRELGVDPARVVEIEPGTDPPRRTGGASFGGEALELLCVGNLLPEHLPNKGQVELIEALDASGLAPAIRLTLVGAGETRAGSGQRRAGSGETRAGSGQRRAGSGETRAGSGQRRAGSGETRAGSGQRRAGSGETRAGSGQRRAGSGETRAGSEQLRWCGESPLPSWVHWAGVLHADELDAAYARSHVFVSNARMESYGLAIAEARARGLVMLVRDGGEAGRHVPTGAGRVFTHINEAIESLRAWLQTPPRFAELRARAIAAARHRDWAQAAAELGAFVDRLGPPGGVQARPGR